MVCHSGALVGFSALEQRAIDYKMLAELSEDLGEAMVKNEFRQILHPNAVLPLKIDGVNVPMQKRVTLLLTWGRRVPASALPTLGSMPQAHASVRQDYQGKVEQGCRKVVPTTQSH